MIEPNKVVKQYNLSPPPAIIMTTIPSPRLPAISVTIVDCYLKYVQSSMVRIGYFRLWSIKVQHMVRSTLHQYITAVL